jgi:hypothetical protein
MVVWPARWGGRFGGETRYLAFSTENHLMMEEQRNLVRASSTTVAATPQCKPSHEAPRA